MGSDGVKSSPVERGVWVLRYLLNTPPHLLTPNVAQLGRFERKVLNTEQLQKAIRNYHSVFIAIKRSTPLAMGSKTLMP